MVVGEKYKGPKQKGFNQTIDNVYTQIMKNSCMNQD